MTTDAIFDRYWNALSNEELNEATAGAIVRFALRLAVQDAYAAGLETCSGMHDDLAAIVASQDGALQAALDQVDPLREERNALQAQLAQLDADNAGLTLRLHNLAGVQVEAQHMRQEIADLREQVIPDYQANFATLGARIMELEKENAGLVRQILDNQIEIDRLTRQAATVVDPTPAAQSANGWGRNDPAWDGMTDEERIALYELHSGRVKFGELPIAQRTEILRRVIFNMTDGTQRLTMAKFDFYKPEWMPIASGLVRVFGGTWPKVLNLAVTPA